MANGDLEEEAVREGGRKEDTVIIGSQREKRQISKFSEKRNSEAVARAR